MYELDSVSLRIPPLEEGYASVAHYFAWYDASPPWVRQKTLQSVEATSALRPLRHRNGGRSSSRSPNPSSDY